MDLSRNLIIILGILVIVVLIFIYYRNYYQQYSINTVVDCTNSPYNIPISDLENPAGINFAYGLWVYMSNIKEASTISYTNIMKRAATTTGSENKVLNVYLKDSTSELYVEFIKSDSISHTNAIHVTSNFPIQKWVFITISVDSGQFIDVYLDGKLVKTAVIEPIGAQPSITTTATATTTTTTGIIVGSFPGYTALFKDWDTAIDPYTVWNEYLVGNGMMQTLASQIGLKMDILKNNVSTSSYRVI